MAQSLLQFGLAITPAILASIIIRRMQMPWERKKRPGERAELLHLLAKDVKHVKAIMATNIRAVNQGRACELRPLPLRNWKQIKHDARLKKYADERIFKTMVRQFREWERMAAS